MSEELFKVYPVYLFGMTKEPLYDKKHMCYYQNIFVRGEVSENFTFNVIYHGVSRVLALKENEQFIEHFCKLINPCDRVPYKTILPDQDSLNFILHGVVAKALTFNGSIIALGNYEEDFWVLSSNFYCKIMNIRKFKENYLKREIVKTLAEINEIVENDNLALSYIKPKEFKRCTEYLLYLANELDKI